MVTPYLPYPHSGGSIRSYNLLKWISRNNQITLFSFIRSKEENKHLSELSQFCTRIKTFYRRPAWSVKNIFLAGFTPYPFLVCTYLSSSGVAASIKEELENERYDLIHAENFYVMPCLPKTTIPTVLVEQTIEYLVYKHFVESSGRRGLKPFFWVDVVKMKRWEKHYWQTADKVIAVSDKDAETMRDESGRNDIEIVPNGVDLNLWKNAKTHQNNQILFQGNFKWMQNVEAAHYLIDKVFPLIKEKIAAATLLISGQDVPSSIMAKSNSVIHVRNLSKDDVEGVYHAYRHSGVLLAPLFGPGGTRLKILSAMASFLPVVTTTVGSEGLGAKDGVDILVGNDAESLAKKTISILTDREKYQSVATAARHLVEEKFDWKHISEHLEKIYEQIIRK